MCCDTTMCSAQVETVGSSISRDMMSCSISIIHCISGELRELAA